MNKNLGLMAILLLPLFLLLFTLKTMVVTSPINTSSQNNELDDPSYVNFIKSQSGQYNPSLKEADLHGTKISVPNEDLAKSPGREVLGQTTEEKWIEIDLSDQRLYAHEGDRIVYNFLVSTGKWAPTPIGEFRIWIKLRYATMQGGNKSDGTYYYLPNVPYVMYFHNGFGLHGTYWHNNFGRPMSHGCVNLSIPDAEKIYFWSGPSPDLGKTVSYPSRDDPGTRVVIHQ